MCGLVGCFGDIGLKQESIFETLLKLDTIRGPHSTGVYAVSCAGKGSLVKDVGTPYQFFDNPLYKEALKVKNNLLMGHNRWATMGKINRYTAHPFEFENIVGAHNGTLTSKYKFINGSKYTVDSEALYDHMDIKGLDDTIENTSGAMALTWWDKAEESINFIRNNERPLFYCVVGQVLYWASEEWMLTVALGNDTKNELAIKELPEYHHLKFKFNKSKLEEFKMVDKSSLKPKLVEYPSTNWSYKGRSNVVRHNDDSYSKIHYVGTIRTIKIESFDSNFGGYVKCSILSDPDVEIRLFKGQHKEIWEKLLSHMGCTYYGMITRPKNKSSNYYCIDPTSLKKKLYLP